MKIANIVLLSAAVAMLGACEKNKPDTATPDDVTPTAEPTSDELPDDSASDEEPGEEAAEEAAEEAE